MHNPLDLKAQTGSVKQRHEDSRLDKAQQY